MNNNYRNLTAKDYIASNIMSKFNQTNFSFFFKF